MSAKDLISDGRSYIAGVEPDGMTDIYEVKILICYLLDCVPEPLTKNQLNTVFQANRLVNYFTFCSALESLKSTGHISQEPAEGGDELYTLNTLGHETAKKLHTALPLSVKEKVVAYTIDMLARIKRDCLHEISSKKVSDGFVVSVRIHDTGTDLLSLDLFVPDEIQTEYIKEAFTENTADIYRGIVALMLRNADDLHGLASEIEQQTEEDRDEE